jgi:hypothetical protein
MAAPSNPVELCHCGKPLHYTDPWVEQLVRKFVSELGEYVPTTVGGRTWLVPRHYIALHGVKASEVAGLGFMEAPHGDPS